MLPCLVPSVLFRLTTSTLDMVVVISPLQPLTITTNLTYSRLSCYRRISCLRTTSWTRVTGQSLNACHVPSRVNSLMYARWPVLCTCRWSKTVATKWSMKWWGRTKYTFPHTCSRSCTSNNQSRENRILSVLRCWRWLLVSTFLTWAPKLRWKVLTANRSRWPNQVMAARMWLSSLLLCRIILNPTTVLCLRMSSPYKSLRSLLDYVSHHAHLLTRSQWRQLSRIDWVQWIYLL